MDNRPYDPDQSPLPEPGSPTAGDSSVLGPHHEMPTPLDPTGGPAQNLSTAGPAALDDPGGLHLQTYSEVGATPDNTNVAHGGAGPVIPPPAEPYAPQAYAPGPGAPPAPPLEERGKGFNWMACCGVTCGLLLVLTIVFVFIGVKYFKPLINSAMQLGNVTEAVKADGAPDEADLTVTAQELSENGAQYENQWVSLTGKISDDPGPSLDVLRQKRGMQDFAGYLIGSNIIVLDVSGSEPKAAQGETIHVIGKPIILDFELLGPVTAKQIQDENKLGDIKQVVYLVTDNVEVVEEEESPEVTEDVAERDT